MEDEISQEYERIKDKISEEEFLKKMDEIKQDYEDVSFVNDVDIARMVVGEYVDEKAEVLSETDKHVADKISKLESGQQINKVIGKIMGISNVKIFTSRKGKNGKLCNMKLADDTDEIRVVLWTQNISLLKNLNEGDVIQINRVDVKDGYRSKEIHLQPRSTINKLDAKDYPNFPAYEEPITPINEIDSDSETVNIIARIIRIPRIRTFERNGKEGQVCSLELQDASGKISYTLWNKDVNLVENLELSEGDSVKILNAQVRENRDEINLSHWDGRIIKDDFNLPEYEESLFKIVDAKEVKDVTLLGIVSKIQDTISFNRADGSTGTVKSIEIADDTGSIRVTLWGEDTNLDITKGDIIKIVGGNIEFDEYASTGYRVNTNWNTRILINPNEDNELIEVLKDYRVQLAPIKIEQVQEIEEDGEEVDVRGRIITLQDSREFQRDDGSIGVVRSGDFADETGMIRLSLWDDKAQEDLKVGGAYQIENARTRMGMYAVELNIGKTVRVIELNEEESKYLPSFETLEELIYTRKSIMDLDEDDRNVRVIARIIDVQNPNEFQRNDGSQGLVRNIEIADDTGSIRVTLWDADAEVEYTVGDSIKIESPSVRFNQDRIELSINRNSKILTPSDTELKNLPSYAELQDIVYQSKTIETLEDNDTNVRISGTLNDLSANNLLLARCPNCNNRLEQNEEEYFCDFCGEEINEPKYLLMIPGRLDDDTGEISITFFSNLVEELLNLKEDEIIDLVEESGDLGVLEGKVEDLEGMTIEVIADVNFDEYNEEIRLSPKKILSKSI